MPTPSREQLETALINADKAGDREAARELANALKAMPEGSPVFGAGEAALAIGSGIVAEPISGLAGIAGAVLPGDPGQGARWVERTRDALSYEPGSETGQEYIQNVGEAVQAVDEFPREYLGQSISEGVDQTTKLFSERGADLLSPFGEKGSAVGSAIGATVIPGAEVLAGTKTLRHLTPDVKGAPRREPRLDPRADTIGTGDVDSAKIKLNEKGKVVKDKDAVETIRQGFDEGLVAAVKASSPQDKANMIRMLDTLERGKKNARHGVVNRPADVVGDSLSDRVKHIKRVNQSAGKRLDSVAKTLKGKPADYRGPVDAFENALDDMGITFEGGKLGFKGSDIEGVKGAQRILQNIVKRMRDTDVPADAYDVHRLKRFIDETVTYGRSQKGLSGRAEAIVKNLRHDLDAVLDEGFPAYNKVNTEYADTISALNDFQGAVGKIDLLGPNADKAIGTASRKLLTNYASRTALLDSIDGLNNVASKYGGKFNDDIIVQAMFVQQLDAMFGTAAKGSFKGEIEQGVRTALREGPIAGAKDAAINKVASKVNDFRGVNEEGAIKALRKLLSESPSGQPHKPGLPVKRQ